MQSRKDTLSPDIIKSWWSAWKSADYSWDGLGGKPWLGWWFNEATGEAFDSADEEGLRVQATLQHYWWDQKDLLIHSPDGVKYTILHAPLMWENGSPSPKNSDEVQPYISETLAHRIARVETTDFEEKKRHVVKGPDRRSQLQGIVVANWNVSLVRDQVSMVLDNAYIGGEWRLEFNKVRSISYFWCTFRNTLFDKEVHFENAKFLNFVLFEKSVFNAGSFFNEANFAVANFDRTVWFEIVEFTDCIFHETAKFEGARFFATAEFMRTIFGGGAIFTSSDMYFPVFLGSSFLDLAFFENAVFRTNALFAQCAFLKEAYFQEAAFCGDALFHAAHFEGICYAPGAAEPVIQPGDRKWFSLEGSSGEVVGDDVLLPRARRSFQALTAPNAVFVGDVDFTNRDLLKPSDLSGCRFLGLLEFHGSTLHQRVNFHDAQLLALDYGALDSTRSRVSALEGPPLRTWPRWRRLWRSRMAHPNRILGSLPRPARVWIYRQLGIRSEAGWPTARGSLLEALRRLNGEPPLSDLVPSERRAAIQSWTETIQLMRAQAAPKQDDKRYEAIEASFRTLKLAMESTRARLSESRFFKLELRARRQRRDPEVPRWERMASRTYGIISDYGDSIVRPLGWSMALVVLFAVLYWLLASFAADTVPEGWMWRMDGFGNALRYSLGRAAPFGALDGEDSWPWLQTWAERGSLFSWAGIIRVLATFQSALAIVLTFLFALAVRRKFQIS